MKHNDNTGTPVKLRLKQYNFFQNQRNIVIGVIFVLLLASLSLAIILNQKNGSAPTAVEQQSTNATAVVSGKAEISYDGQKWEPSANSKTVKAGSYVRTLKNSRAIITFEDESVARLNYSTSLRIESLSKNNTSITHLTGHLYNRAITGSGYSVTLDESSFSTKGTAFRTVSDKSEIALEVYDGTVAALINKKTQDVKSGNGLNVTDSSESKDVTLRKLDLSKLQNDEFILWNLARDSQNPNFKNHLGYLKDLSTTPNQDTSSTPSTPSTPTPKPAISMKLSGRSTAENKFELSWRISDLPKVTYTALIFSRKTSNPTIADYSNGENETSVIDIDNKQNFTWDYPDGQTVWFRLCAYDHDEMFGQEDIFCNVGVSNVISYNAPYVADKIVQPGAVNLSAEGTNLSWTYDGTAPFGFIVIGFDFIDFEASTTSTSMDISSTPSRYNYFYVCKKGYYEQVNCSEGISVDRS